MTIKQNGGIFGRNPTFNDIETDGTITSSGDIIANSKVRIEATTNIALQMLDTDGGFPASYLLVENGGRDLSIFAPQDIIFDQDGAETARFRDGGGLCFNGDTAAANALDDYEEGTWTPVYNASTSSPTVTHDKQTGYYVKIGRMVFISLQLRTDSVSGGSGNLRISGLPYSASSGDGYPSALSVGYKADFVTNGPDFAHVNDGQAYLSLYSNGTTVATPLTVVNLNTGSNDNGLYISGSYLTA